LSHILIASLISAPAAITIAHVMIPETATPTSGKVTPPHNTTSTMDAITHGATDGLKLLLNIITMMIALIAMVHLANQLLEFLPSVAGDPLSLQRILGWIMAPVTWLMGIPWQEAQTAGALMGTKTVLNELLAYLDLAALPADALTPRSRLIMTYALCGFANFGSLGIMIGGMGSMVPERRPEIIELGMRSLVAGTIGTCMTGTIVGLIY